MLGGGQDGDLVDNKLGGGGGLEGDLVDDTHKLI